MLFSNLVLGSELCRRTAFCTAYVQKRSEIFDSAMNRLYDELGYLTYLAQLSYLLLRVSTKRALLQRGERRQVLNSEPCHISPCSSGALHHGCHPPLAGPGRGPTCMAAC